MKTNPFYYILALVCLVFAGYVHAASVKVTWDASCNQNVIKYTVLYTSNTLTVPQVEFHKAETNECGVSYPAITNTFYGFYTNSIDVMGVTNIVCQITNLVRGVTYYFTVKCSDIYGLESERATEIKYTVPMSNLTFKVGGVTITVKD